MCSLPVAGSARAADGALSNFGATGQLVQWVGRPIVETFELFGVHFKYLVIRDHEVPGKMCGDLCDLIPTVPLK